jgi:hypothetical protein
MLQCRFAKFFATKQAPSMGAKELHAEQATRRAQV